MKLIKQIEYEEKKSKFIAYKFEMTKNEDNKEVLEYLKKLHSKAKHILRVVRCPNQYGIIISEASEDREPISSMKKCKELMERKKIDNIGIYIVRYYGGVNLGASRLDHVYFTLATKVLNDE